ncbi:MULTISPECIES: tyrosine-type recombinase/integrase [Photobacterium]|uniref:Site-specific tyrosine recombinase XerC n=1 Tax=Photobacterium aquimaris TaxID=512643 RepID=A0A1Y6L1E6_9GAMM|nr:MULTISPECIES: tyrosine-type recombinase/integrase [Photobacterium]OBU32966.1 recombinase XerC [Photobacterium kishitanii]PSW48042.1 recombinase XerC [Photobacterium kishitanii]SMY18203.1 site-specific tyrosine recombinase XerC [Photobacterium aquimaris]
MKKNTTNNVRIIHEYSKYLSEAKRLDQSTVDGVMKSINRFEKYVGYIDFNKFKAKHAIGFKKYLLNQKSIVTGDKLSKATVLTATRHMKAFFQYLVTQKGYRGKINYSDIEYFNLSEKDTRVANTKRPKKVAAVEQIVQTLEIMPCSTMIEMRDRALFAFVILTGARDGAVASAKIKHIDIAEQNFYQDAREVNTKFSKSFTTYFFPVGELPLKVLTEWIDYLTKELGYKPNDPLFPKTKLGHNKNQQFEAAGLLKEHWSNADPIRKVFKWAFEAADLPYFNPHSFRNTLVRLGENLCRTPEDFKAWSQNLGHESVLTSFYSYGDVPDYKQAELLRKLAKPAEKTSSVMEEQFKQFMAFQEMMYKN